MTSSSTVGVIATFGGLLAAVSLLSSAGIASAEPGDGPLIQTTCSYAQIVAALRVEAPDLAARLDQRPDAQAKLQSFIALPVDQRKQRLQERLAANPEWRAKIDEKSGTPEGQEKIQMLGRIADSCHGY
jgi:hemophore-related protein